jgi:threonine/homoserine/homoserine lactone efflux protein
LAFEAFLFALHKAARDMNFILDGIKLGLILAMLVGPIFFTLVQVGVEEGLRAGSMVGLGIWVSDALFIAGAYFGISYLNHLVEGPQFALYLGFGGSLILASFGLATLLTAPRIGQHPQWERAAFRASSYWSLWARGFLINTINPFTLFFWIGVATTMAANERFAGPADASLFFGSILVTIVATDLSKVLLAKRIRRLLRPLHLMWLRRISGAALIVFAIVLLLRVWWMG